MSIASSAILARLNISVWTANKLDKTATDQVTTNNHADSKAAQVRKNLMAGTKARKDISDYAAECRLWHNQLTLAWEDRGSRLLPTSLFMDYKQEANSRQKTFTLMVDKFLANYDAHVQTSANYLGGLFDTTDYPTAAEVRTKFGFNLVFNPVPEAGHFVLDIPAQELEDTKRSCEQEIESKLNDAMRGAWDRLHKQLTSMSEKLSTGDDATKKRWHDSFVMNAVELCEMLTHLNVTRDPKLEQARQALETAMSGLSVEALKTSDSIRATTKDKVDAILERFEW
jgi:hypothetical protein